MSININNYEEYFLLCADNELSSTERLEVENFLSQHPQYKNEWELLMGTKLLPSVPVNSIAPALLKLPSGKSAEEAMLLEADGEISQMQLQELEELCHAFPQLQKDRDLLNSIKLDRADEVAFSNKSLLYRHEPRVISLRLWKPAVAAALIGAGLFIGLNQTHKADESELVAVQENGSIVKEDTALFDAGVSETQITNDSNDEPVVKQTKETPATQSTTARHVSGSVSMPSEANRGKTKMNAKDKNTSHNIIAVQTANPVLENINNLERNNNAYTPVSLQKRMEPNMAPPGEVRLDVERLTASRPLDADLTVQKNEFAQTAAGETESNTSIGHILFVDEGKVNRSKLGGFVRKVKRTIEKKTNINLPDEVRLAGFEIAIK